MQNTCASNKVFLFKFFTMRSNLFFKPEFTSRSFKKFQQKIKLPKVGVEHTQLTITDLGISHCLVVILNLQSRKYKIVHETNFS